MHTAGDFLEAVLKAGYQLDKLEGKKLFHVALQFMNAKVLETLTDQSDDLGIDLKDTDNRRRHSVLHVACITKKVSLLRKILAIADKIDVNGKTEQLYETTAFTEFTTQNYYTKYAKATAFFRACEGNFVEGVAIILENAQELDFDLNAMGKSPSNYDMITPFGVAVKNGHIEVVRKLLEASEKNFITTANAGVTLGGSHRRSFSIACEEGNVEMAKLLLNHDESQAENEMNFVDDRGRNTLHYACKSKSLPMVKFAMANLSSIAVNARDHSGNTPYAFARRSGNLRIVNFLAKYKAHL